MNEFHANCNLHGRRQHCGSRVNVAIFSEKFAYDAAEELVSVTKYEEEPSYKNVTIYGRNKATYDRAINQIHRFSALLNSNKGKPAPIGALDET